eukprot:m.9154 g.9154  ORF g.9154 m.9154 type:complete len:400 (+) comp21129_c0_seq1:92-1291(+)
MGERSEAALTIQRRYRRHQASKGDRVESEEKQAEGKESAGGLEVDNGGLGKEFAALCEREMRVGDEQDEEKQKREMDAAIVLQKHFRGRKVRKEKKLRLKKTNSELPKNIEIPMLSQQIVDEVTRTMALLVQHAPGTLNDDQIKRTKLLHHTSLTDMPRWMPKVEESDEDLTVTKSCKAQKKRDQKDSLWSLKRPLVKPHHTKKQTNYLRVYLKSVGKPEKASASIRARFKSHPKTQPSELTDVWDLRKKELGHHELQSQLSEEAIPEYSGSSLALQDSYGVQEKSWTAPYYSYPLLPPTWQMPVQSSSLQLLQQRDSFYSDYDYFHSSPSVFQQTPSFSNVHKSPPQRMMPKPGAHIRLEPLPRQPWSKPHQPKKNPAMSSYAERYKTLNDEKDNHHW